jgi:predicted regulator of Ras-like GTPase activity (Roadblock/LC7/MglB family)
MRQDILLSILSQLNSTSSDIEASAIISTDGLTMASMGPSGMEEDRIGILSAGLLSLGKWSAKESLRGKKEQVLIKGEFGYLVMVQSGSELILTVLARSNAKMGIVILDVMRAAESVQQLLCK